MQAGEMGTGKSEVKETKDSGPAVPGQVFLYEWWGHVSGRGEAAGHLCSPRAALVSRQANREPPGSSLSMQMRQEQMSHHFWASCPKVLNTLPVNPPTPAASKRPSLPPSLPHFFFFSLSPLALPLMFFK